jgi:CheY-like chemotaxis protein
MPCRRRSFLGSEVSPNSLAAMFVTEPKQHSVLAYLSISGEGMASVASILCVGEDPALLSTRVMLLERLGAEVKWATSIAEALEQVANESFVLVVLCHSLKQVDAVALTNATSTQKPPPLIVQIIKRFDCEEELAQILCDAVIDSHPASLTNCARALLLRRSESAKSPRSELRFGDASKFAGHP